MLEHALKYAALGWKIFPLAPGQKTPITAHGVKDATSDPEQIRRWWTDWPTANIGLACGSESGVYVIDVDISASGEINGLVSLEQFPALPDTVRQDTPRGGFHAFYQTSDPPANRNGFRPGIDIRGTGYYVVLAPSIHPNGGRYSWAAGSDPWEHPLAEYPDFMRPVKRAPWVAPPAPAQPMPRVHDDDILRRASAYLATCEPAIQGCAGHDKLLRAAGCMIHGFMLSDSQARDLLVREYNPRCVPPWNLADPKDEKDFNRKISESRKNPPQKSQGWLLYESGYVQPDNPEMSREHINKIVAYMQAKQAGRAAGPRPEPTPPQPEPVERDGELEFLCKPTGLAGEICSWMNATAIRQQPFLSLACALTFMGALFGRKIEDELGGRTNLYCMGVGPSSSGKTGAIRQIRKLCAAAECTKLLGGDGITSDSAIEDRVSREASTLFLWDEIGLLLSSVKSGTSCQSQVISCLMKLYSAAGDVYKGREYADAEKQRTITQPCCCIYGTSTPERFTDGISQAELQDGWIGRCLVFCSDSIPEKTRVRNAPPPPDSVIEKVRAWFERGKTQPPAGTRIDSIVSWNGEEYESAPPKPMVVPTSPEAERIFVDFDAETARYGREFSALACLWAKGEENARRIALIIAAGDNFDSPIISAANADYACRLIKYLLNHFGTNVVPEIVTCETDAKKRRVISVIRDAGINGIPKWLLTRKTQWAKGPERGHMISDLAEAGEIASAPHGDGISFWTAENYQKFMAKKKEGEQCKSQ